MKKQKIHRIKIKALYRLNESLCATLEDGADVKLGSWSRWIEATEDPTARNAAFRKGRWANGRRAWKKPRIFRSDIDENTLRKFGLNGAEITPSKDVPRWYRLSQASHVRVGGKSYVYVTTANGISIMRDGSNAVLASVAFSRLWDIMVRYGIKDAGSDFNGKRVVAEVAATYIKHLQSRGI